MRHFATVFLCVFGLASSFKILDNDDGVPPLYEPGMMPEGAEFGEAQREPGWMSQAGQFEGDMILTESQLRQLNDSSSERNGLLDETTRWPEGKIPYVITNDFTSDEVQIIKSGFKSYAYYTCLRMVKRTTEEDYINIVKGKGCFSAVGRMFGKQKLSLDDGCVQHSTVVHELMHAAGFFHEHNRPDRNTYIRIAWENIPQNWKRQFRLTVKKSEVTTYGEPYDYRSIMHYGAYSSSKNGEKTMVRLDGKNEKLGNSVGFTQIDVNKLNKMYDCDNAVSCEDKKKYENKCPKWVENGDCTSKKYSKFMARNCKKSCGHCEE